jgi:hypothetical protein
MTGLQNSRNPALADYDWREFARAIHVKRRPDPRGIRAIVADIGITFTDMSRAMSGQGVSAPKVIALCRWLGVPFERFYLEPDLSLKTVCCSGSNVKHSAPGDGDFREEHP